MALTLDGYFRVGEDALLNLFDVQFGVIPTLSGLGIGDLPVSGSLLRVESVSMPEPSIEMYENHYKTLEVKRVSGKMTRPTDFTVTFRADRQMLLYKFFTFWRNQAMDVTTGVMGDDGKISGLESSFRSSMTVAPCDSTGNILIDNASKITAWIFNGIFPSSVGAISYDYTSGDKVTFDVTFQFVSMREFLA